MEMTVTRTITLIAAIVAVALAGASAILLGAPRASAATFGMQVAEDDVPGDKSLLAPAAEAATPANGDPTLGAHAPKYPIRFKTVDYQDSGDTGHLKLAGSGPPDSPVYVYFDDAPFVKVQTDKDGVWSVDKDVKIDEARHMLRAEQYDASTRMVSGRAMVTLERAPANAAQAPGAAPAAPAQ
jgi:hypothetical protein